jgi:stage II sporulation protein D
MMLGRVLRKIVAPLRRNSKFETRDSNQVRNSNLRIPLAAFLSLLSLLLLPCGCSEDNSVAPIAVNSPQLRVLIVQGASLINLQADSPQVLLDSQPVALSFPGGMAVPIALTPQGWHIGRLMLRSGTLDIEPTAGGPIAVDGTSYRGSIRLVPLAGGRINVINNVAVEDYLAGVVTKEMYPDWPVEALKAQAVASRTYALYEAHTTGKSRSWDVYGDQRSQMYGGLNAETASGRQAVASTEGMVLTYGPGNGTIFRSYFSSCCGGVTQAASDAFPGEPYIPPLAEQSHGTLASGCKYFNWGPITISKQELTRRIHIWAQRTGEQIGRTIAEQSMDDVLTIQIQSYNRFGRPNRVLVVDARGTQYSWPAEQLRAVVNTDAGKGPTLPSSFCKISASPGSSQVTFYDGHGFGHGVGMCQWTADAEAAAGENFEQILADGYPQAKLERAY